MLLPVLDRRGDCVAVAIAPPRGFLPPACNASASAVKNQAMGFRSIEHRFEHYRRTGDPADPASRREDADAVGQAIDELADPAKSILVLRYRHGLEPADIAAQLGMPPATVRSHLHRGIQSVRKRVSVAGVAIFGLDDAETC